MAYGMLQKWGNSQGLRIPKSILAEANLSENEEVELFVEPDQLIIRKRKGYKNLDALFAGYKGTYRPQEVDTGTPVGGEVIE